METRDFGWALAQLNAKARVTRSGWNGRGQWVRRVDLYNDPEFKVLEGEGSVGTWLPFFAIRTVENKLVPWIASQTDLQANDWDLAP